MSGVSHMLPFVIGGGIMIAIAFLIDTLCGYGGTGGGNFGTCTPLSALFKYIGDFSMGLMVPVLAGYIAYSIADRPGLAVGFTGGLLAANGNAVLAKYVFANESLGGFSKFISNFAFVGENGGNTVSGFLGGIAAGFVAGFIVLGLKKLCSKLPDSLEGIKPTLMGSDLGLVPCGNRRVTIDIVILFHYLLCIYILPSARVQGHQQAGQCLHLLVLRAAGALCSCSAARAPVYYRSGPVLPWAQWSKNFIGLSTFTEHLRTSHSHRPGPSITGPTG